MRTYVFRFRPNWPPLVNVYTPSPPYETSATDDRFAGDRRLRSCTPSIGRDVVSTNRGRVLVGLPDGRHDPGVGLHSAAALARSAAERCLEPEEARADRQSRAIDPSPAA